MKTIKTQNKEFIVIKVPEDAYDFDIIISKSKHPLNNRLEYKIPAPIGQTKWGWYDKSLRLKTGNHKILGKLLELSEEECSRFVEFLFYNSINMFKNYKYPVTTSYPFLSAKESLISLLQSEGVDTSNPRTILLIEKI